MIKEINLCKWEMSSMPPRGASKTPVIALVVFIVASSVSFIVLFDAKIFIEYAIASIVATSSVTMILLIIRSGSAERCAVMACIRWVVHGLLAFTVWSAVPNKTYQFIFATILVFAEPAISMFFVFMSDSGRWYIERTARSSERRWVHGGRAVDKSAVANIITITYAASIPFYASFALGGGNIDQHPMRMIYVLAGLVKSLAVITAMLHKRPATLNIAIAACWVFVIFSFVRSSSAEPRILSDLPTIAAISIYLTMSDYMRRSVWGQVRNRQNGGNNGIA